tara:strand:- start:3410 stop:4207 length:798 start_codon:yes stop_codon:yes gene_type:complete
MIKFFRKIRQSLLMKNQTSKYFKYAIGEIILVVIGILIALSLNNWNQKRVDNNYVSLILKEIYYDLSADYKIIYEGIEPRLNLKIKGTEKIKEFMIEGAVVNDSSFINSYNNMNVGFALTQRTGAYESLKQNGLDKIRNDSIRTQLLQFYESTIPRAVQFISEYDDYIMDRVKILEDDIFNYEFSTINDGTTRQIKVLKYPDNLDHQSLHKIYKLKYRDTRSKRYRIKYLKESYNRIMRMIEKELEIRKVQFKYFDSTVLKRDFS